MHAISKQVADYRSLKATMKDLGQKLDDLEKEIKDYMGEREEVLVDGYTVRWKTVAQNRFDTASFRKQHEALYEQFVITGETRRFTVT